MTREDWAKVEKALSGAYGRVKLMVDGHEVVFLRGLVSKNVLGIGTYVDGTLSGAWMGEKKDCPEQRYLRPQERFVFPAKYRANIAKLSKKDRKLLGEKLIGDYNKKSVSYTPIWASATQLRRHYQKTFASIELVEVCPE